MCLIKRAAEKVGLIQGSTLGSYGGTPPLGHSPRAVPLPPLPVYPPGPLPPSPHQIEQAGGDEGEGEHSAAEVAGIHNSLMTMMHPKDLQGRGEIAMQDKRALHCRGRKM